jgi:Ni/Co efflux regulator RcnB
MSIASRSMLCSTLLVVAVCVSTPVMAQYVWTDSNNVRHYSDKPPPASVPANRILKTLRSRPSLTNEPVIKEVGAALATNIAATKAPLTMAEKNAEYQKRKMEQTEKDKKAEQEAKRATDKTRYCESLQERKRTLEAGQRLTKINEKGERYFVSDDQRSRDLEETNRNLQQCR